MPGADSSRFFTVERRALDETGGESAERRRPPCTVSVRPGEGERHSIAPPPIGPCGMTGSPDGGYRDALCPGVARVTEGACQRRPSASWSLDHACAA